MLVADFKRKKWPVSCSYYLGWKPTDGTQCQSGSSMGWSRGGFAESLSEGLGLGGTQPPCPCLIENVMIHVN